MSAFGWAVLASLGAASLLATLALCHSAKGNTTEGDQT